MMTQFRHSLIASLVLTFVLSGCATRQNLAGNEYGDMRETASTRAVLTAAHERQISLFGEMPQHESQPFISRRVVSLGQHTFAEIGRDMDVDLDPTGRFMVFASTRHSVETDLYIKQVDGVTVTQLTSDPAADLQPCFSPDGTKVAFASNRSGNWDIWVADRSGGAPIQITSGFEDELHPTWSPDGTEIVYCGLPQTGGQWELWITSASAGALKRFIGYGLFPQWSPIGNTIVFQRARERGSRWFSIWTINLVDGEPRYPTEVASSAGHAMILPAWSKDGRRIAFTTTTAAPLLDANGLIDHALMDVWVMNSDGRGKVCVTDSSTMNFSPVFSKDGRIFFSSNRSGHENIWSLAPPPGNSNSPADITVTSGTGGPDVEAGRAIQATLWENGS